MTVTFGDIRKLGRQHEAKEIKQYDYVQDYRWTWQIHGLRNRESRSNSKKDIGRYPHREVRGLGLEQP